MSKIDLLETKIEREFIYDAFICYQHANKAVAVRLQKLLERYTPPGKSSKRMHFFRDEDELPACNNLNEELKAALKNSHFLIVLCSKTITQSEWCPQEIAYFKELHDGSTDNIITLLIENGKPDEVFPPELRSGTRTITAEDGSVHTEMIDMLPLAANISDSTKGKPLKQLNHEYLRIAARLLGYDSYDALYKRHQRRFVRRVITGLTALILFLSALVVYSIIMISQINAQKSEVIAQKEQVTVQKEQAVENLNYAKSLLLSNAIDYADELNQQGARTRAASVLLNAYENIDTSRENANDLLTKFRDTAINTLHSCNEALPFAKVDLHDEIMQIDIISEHNFAIITTEENLYKIDMNSGDILKKYDLPNGEQAVAVSTHDIYAFVATKDGSVILINTITHKGTISKSLASYYENDVIADISYNENSSAITVLTYKTGRFSTTPDSVAYIPADETEVFTKVLLTVIPCDLKLLKIHQENKQVIVYKSDTYNANSMFSNSGLKQYIALKYNYETYVLENNGRYQGELLNSNITLIDLSKFNPLLSPDKNKEIMTNTIDCRFNDEYLFKINKYSISSHGYLYLDGNILNDMNDIDTSDNSKQRTIVYDSVNDTVVFNENLMNQTSKYGSGFLPIRNQYSFEIDRSPYADQQMIDTVQNEDWLVYLDEQEDVSFIRVFDLRWGHNSEYELPTGFTAKYCYMYDKNAVDFLTGGEFVIVGNNVYSQNLILKDIWIKTQSIELQTLPIASTAADVDWKYEMMIVGYKDGSLLMFNYGKSLTSDTAASIIRRIDSGGKVYLGSENLDIDLPRVTGTYIDVISYDKSRTFVFGYEDNYSEDNEEKRKVYSIWDMESGEVVKSFYSRDYIKGERKYYRFDMQVNSDLTYAVVQDCIDYRNSEYYFVYYIVDISSDKIVHTYSPSQPGKAFFGVGSDPNIIWLFREDILLLEQIDVSNGEIISKNYITERLEGGVDSLFWGEDDISKVFFNMDSDYIVFFASKNSVYSLSSGKTIFVGDITEVESDCSAIYVGYDYERIELSPEALYETLKQSPYVGTMLDEDIKVTGLDIFE